MPDNTNADKVAQELSQDINNALNRQIEERFRAALLLVNPDLEMETVTVASDVANDNQLTVDGVDDATIDEAMKIFERGA